MKIFALPCRVEYVWQNKVLTPGFICNRCLKIPSKCQCSPIEVDSFVSIKSASFRNVDEMFGAIGR